MKPLPPIPTACLKVQAPLVEYFLIIIILSLSAAASASISLMDFDHVAFKWDSGETATGTAIGVMASPAPVYEAAVNFMMIDSVFPLYLTDGPNGEATVAFGFADHTIWTPTNGDGMDLTGAFENTGDRIYAVIDSDGNIDLMSAENFGAGVLIANGSTTLDPNMPYYFMVEPDFDWVYVFHGTEIIVEGNPFFGPNTASRANLAPDFTISVGCICDDEPSVADATINNLARDATLEMYEFPQVMGQLSEDFVNLRPIRPFPVMLANEEADLVITLNNVGSFTASGISVTLGLPSGEGMTFTGSNTLDFGDLAPETSTMRRFSIQTSGTAEGVYPLRLSVVSSGGNQSLETWLPVWADSVAIDDPIAGLGTAIMGSPFGVHTTEVVAPEHMDQNGIPEYFDLQHVTHEVVHAVPYLGVHWGEGEAILPAGPGPIMGDLPLETGNVGGEIHLLTVGGGSIGLSKCKVQLLEFPSGNVMAQDVTDNTGSYLLGPAPYGAYTLKVLLPRWVFNRPRTSVSGVFELGVPILLMDDWQFVAPPMASAPGPQATPGNGQGQTGTKTKPKPAAPNVGPKPNSGRAKSMVAGFGASAIVWGIDALLAPETFGGALASFLVGSGAGAGTNLAVDPQGEDLFWVGEEMTPPQTFGELTLSEKVEVDVDVSPPFSFQNPSTITTNFSYTRTTDMATYTYSGSEVLIFDSYLSLSVDAVPVQGPDCGDVQLTATVHTSDGTPLKGPQALVQVWLADVDGTAAFSETMLRDDGQGLDATASDGVYSGAAAATCAAGGRMVSTYASYNGFMPHNSPPATGWLNFNLSGISPVPNQGTPQHRTQLYRNSPNPFNPSTTLRYDLANAAMVHLQIFDVSGKLVRELVSSKQEAGQHTVLWNGRDDEGRGAASGIYFARLSATGIVQTQKLVLTK